ncbi:hypothetical protein [Streptomyces lasiicapitis]|uniref:hypothetical protein n=1 Tax=Streptomyces lasiicapitis TaxID=1923961 RepID=UPI0036462F68
MTEPRHTADTINDDALDQLYAKVAVAEQASSAERTFKWYADDAQRRVRLQRERAEQAEAAIARVQRAVEALREDAASARKMNHETAAYAIEGSARRITLALDEPAPAATEETEPAECGHTVTGLLGRTVGPCIRRPGHPEMFHRAANGTEWRTTRRTARTVPEPHDAGPSVTECTADDRNWDIEKAGDR